MNVSVLCESECGVCCVRVSVECESEVWSVLCESECGVCYVRVSVECVM